MSLSLLVTSYRKLLLQTNFTDTSKFLPKYGHRKQDLNHIFTVNGGLVLEGIWLALTFLKQLLSTGGCSVPVTCKGKEPCKNDKNKSKIALEKKR